MKLIYFILFFFLLLVGSVSAGNYSDIYIAGLEANYSVCSVLLNESKQDVYDYQRKWDNCTDDRAQFRTDKNKCIEDLDNLENNYEVCTSKVDDLPELQNQLLSLRNNVSNQLSELDTKNNQTSMLTSQLSQMRIERNAAEDEASKKFSPIMLVIAAAIGAIGYDQYKKRNKVVTHDIDNQFARR